MKGTSYQTEIDGPVLSVFVGMFVGKSIPCTMYMEHRRRHQVGIRMWEVSQKFIIPMDKRAEFVLHSTSLLCV